MGISQNNVDDMYECRVVGWLVDELAKRKSFPFLNSGKKIVQGPKANTVHVCMIHAEDGTTKASRKLELCHFAADVGDLIHCRVVRGHLCMCVCCKYLQYSSAFLKTKC